MHVYSTGKLRHTDYLGKCLSPGKLMLTIHTHTSQWHFVSSFDNDICCVPGLINLRILQVTEHLSHVIKLLYKRMKTPQLFVRLGRYKKKWLCLITEKLVYY